MCGGGGGGDGGAADREKERERKNAAATASINAIFGLDDESLYNIPQTREIPVTEQDEYGNPRNVGVRTEEFTAPDTALIEKSKANKTAREELYSSSRQDITDYFKKQLEEQQTREERLAREQFAQRGWTGGAHEISFGKDFEKSVQDALLNIGTRADTAVSDIRGADERSRQNLISQILSGMDEQSAITGATAALTQNVDTAKSAALQQSLGDVFGNVANLYNLRTVTDARNKERDQYNNAIRSLGLDPASYAGTIT